jgi:hypothetical protein
MTVLSWMPWYYLPVMVLGIALPLYFVVKLLRGSAERNRILSTGLPAQATISRIWETGTRVNDRPLVGFELQVWPPGGAPYVAQCSMIVSPLAIPRIQPGATVAVKIDRADASKVAIVL